jgi:hypothetical protein
MCVETVPNTHLFKQIVEAFVVEFDFDDLLDNELLGQDVVGELNVNRTCLGLDVVSFVVFQDPRE